MDVVFLEVLRRYVEIFEHFDEFGQKDSLVFTFGRFELELSPKLSFINSVNTSIRILSKNVLPEFTGPFLE